MKKFKVSLSTFFYTSIVLFCCIISSYVILEDINRPEYYKYLPILPVSFGLITILVFPIYKYLFESMGVTIIVVSYFIRMVITPLVMCLGDYQSIALNLSVYDEMNSAIILMIYEAIVVFVALFHYKNKYNEYRINKNINNELLSFSNVKLRVVIISIILLLIISYILYPQLTLQYKFFIQTSLEENVNYNRLVSQIKESVPTFIYYFTSIFTEIIRIIMVLAVISYLKRRLNTKISLFLSLLIIIFNALITSSENAFSLFMSLAYLMLIIKMYPKYKGEIKLAIVIGAPTFIFLMLYFKTGFGYNDNKASMDFTQTLSRTLQAYFSGPANIASGIYLNSITDVNKLSILVADLGRWIPFVGYFFQGVTDSTQLFNDGLFNSVSRRDQIIPYISQSAFYLTTFLAPLLSLILVKYISKIESKLNSTRNLGMYLFNTLTIIIFSTTLVSYNISIFILQIFSVVLPLYFLISKKEVGN